MRKKKRVIWPKLRMLDSGASMTDEKLSRVPVYLPDEYRKFLCRYNGGRPVKASFRDPSGDTMEAILHLDYFYGVFPRSRSSSKKDLVRDGILEWRHDLPRWSIPVARVDEECFLLIFEQGPHQGGVWYFIYGHDITDEDDDPNDGDGLFKVAESIPEFLAMLDDYSAFLTQTSYAVPDDLKPRELDRRLKSLGCTVGRYNDSRGRFDNWSWSEFDDQTFLSTEMFVVENGRKADVPYSWISIPKLPGVPLGQRVLHLNMSKTYHLAAVKKLRRKLGPWISESD